MAREFRDVSGDAPEADGLEWDPAIAVFLQGPPLVTAVHLLDEGEVAVDHALADAPVALLEEVLEVFHGKEKILSMSHPMSITRSCVPCIFYRNAMALR